MRLMFMDYWPRLLHGLVRQYGPGRVWWTGMDALGYPPGWIHTTGEALVVSRALEEKEI